MFKRWFKKKEQPPISTKQETLEEIEDGAGIELAGRTIRRTVKPVIGASILQLAEQHKVDWNSNCRRGTCARCRSKVLEGMEHLSEPNEAEIARLEPEELEQGYRLGCQVKIVSRGKVVVKHAPYF
jgi:2Fe-2S ferredoxin